MNAQDKANQKVWSQQGAINWMGRISGFTDDGERSAYAYIADDSRDQPILDLGVGPGRTIALLHALSTQYVALDYQPAMVKRARTKFPAIDIQLGDARDLSRFANDSFALTVFSYAGIDAVDREGRARILSEVHRVLKPNGIFWFSTLNKDGHSPQERPWSPQWPTKGSNSLLGHSAALARTLKEIPIGLFNYASLNRLRSEGDGWLIAPFAAASFGLVVHYTTLANQQAELANVGFRPTIDIFDPTGKTVRVADDLHDIDFFNIVCRK